jgi:hypothetical protein
LLIRYSQGKNGEGERESVPNNTRLFARTHTEGGGYHFQLRQVFWAITKKKGTKGVFQMSFKPPKKCRSSKIKLISMNELV